MEAEDTILDNVRVEIRQLRQLAENYRIQQRAVELAYLQLENALEVFRSPPIPTSSTDSASLANSAANAAALTQQVLNAQRSLPSAQNQLYLVWISFQTTRLQLYRDLELLPLDQRGVWIDELATLSTRKSNPTLDSSLGADRAGRRAEESLLHEPRVVAPAEQTSQKAKP
jgi:hypothetical protein